MNLFCSICKQEYAHKDAYNDHLVRQKHKRNYSTQYTFWSGLKDKKPEIFEEWLKTSQ